MHDKPEALPSSYRDPSGYVFTYRNEIYRQVNKGFKKDFDAFVGSGLYAALVNEGLLIPHETVAENLTKDEDRAATLKPEPIGRISYPYEWCFPMLKEAALLTLKLAVKALDFGLALKDASAYNVQFHKGRMIFIDTLSFERYREGEPWIAYRQFCEHFLAPLALMHYARLPLPQIFLAYPNGLPLPVVKSLLPWKSRFNLLLYLHLHLHAKVSAKAQAKESGTVLSKEKLVNLLNGLQSLTASFQLNERENVWGNYYEEAEARPGYLAEKKGVVSAWLAQAVDAKTVIDIGGNRGEFSLLATAAGKSVVCADAEHRAVERLYRQIKEQNISNVLPLCIDFTNPSPALGVNNRERPSFFERAASDVALALAVVHHLAIGKNVPFSLIAALCAKLCETLIVEFVAKEDEKVQLLLQSKKDVYDWYNEENFLAAFSKRFRVIESKELTSSRRTLYLMKKL